MPGIKSHSLNLWTVDDASKLDIDVLTDEVKIATSGGQKVSFNPVVEIKHPSGDISDLGQKMVDVEQAIVDSGNASDSALAIVNNDLQNYKTANDASVGSLQASLATETAQRIQGQADDASVRASDKSELEGKITAEETRAVSAEGSISTAVTIEKTRAQTEEAKLSASISSVNSTLTSAINVESQRIDDILSGASVNLDELKEITDAYSNADSSILNQIADMTISINNLVQRVNALTSSSEDDVTVALNVAVGELDLFNDKAFLQREFSLSFRMKDLYQASSSSYLGWSTYRALIIANSSGVLTGGADDLLVENFLQASLDAVYGSLVLKCIIIKAIIKYE